VEGAEGERVVGGGWGWGRERVETLMDSISRCDPVIIAKYEKRGREGQKETERERVSERKTDRERDRGRGGERERERD
jgi:hypothetical protein